MDIPGYFFLIILTLLFSAFFSGMEIAFVSANKLRAELDKKKGGLSAKIIAHFFSQESHFITAMLVGNNIALVVYGIFFAKLLEPFLSSVLPTEAVVLLVQTVVSTLIILVTAEFLPKTIFRIVPNQTLNIFAVPLFVLFYLLFPIVTLVVRFSNWMLEKFLRLSPNEENNPLRKIDLDYYIKDVTSQAEGSDQEIEHEIQFFQNALEFSNVKARECMVPRTEIVALEVGLPIEELKQKFIETSLSKILIYRENIDKIIGYVHSFELFKGPKTIKSILLPVSIVPETIPAEEVMEQLIRERRSMAVVVDEFGGTAGIITLEDVVEEIFGEIEDEHDQEVMVEKQVAEDEYVLSARLEVDYLNEKYKLNLPPSEEYETLAGLVLEVHASIPKQGEEVRLEPFLFEALKVSNNKLELIKLRVVAE